MHCFGIRNKKLVFLDSPTVSKERERIDGQFVYILCGKVSASLIYFEKSRETPCLYALLRERSCRSGLLVLRSLAIFFCSSVDLNQLMWMDADVLFSNTLIFPRLLPLPPRLPTDFTSSNLFVSHERSRWSVSTLAFDDTQLIRVFHYHHLTRSARPIRSLPFSTSLTHSCIPPGPLRFRPNRLRKPREMCVDSRGNTARGWV